MLVSNKMAKIWRFENRASQTLSYVLPHPILLYVPAGPRGAVQKSPIQTHVVLYLGVNGSFVVTVSTWFLDSPRNPRAQTFLHPLQGTPGSAHRGCVWTGTGYSWIWWLPHSRWWRSWDHWWGRWGWRRRRRRNTYFFGYGFTLQFRFGNRGRGLRIGRGWSGRQFFTCSDRHDCISTRERWNRIRIHLRPRAQEENDTKTKTRSSRGIFVSQRYLQEAYLNFAWRNAI